MMMMPKMLTSFVAAAEVDDAVGDAVIGDGFVAVGAIGAVAAVVVVVVNHSHSIDLVESYLNLANLPMCYCLLSWLTFA